MLSPRQISSLIKQWSQQLRVSDAARQLGANGEEADPVPLPTHQPRLFTAQGANLSPSL